MLQNEQLIILLMLYKRAGCFQLVQGVFQLNGKSGGPLLIE